MKLCKCGCGKEIIFKKHHNWYKRSIEYLWGHNGKIQGKHFEKGQIPWNKNKGGYKNPEHSAFLKDYWKKHQHPMLGKRGYTPWNKGKIGVMPTTWNKGKPMSLETKEKMIKTKSLNPTRPWLGKHRDLMTKSKLRIARMRQRFPLKNSSIELKLYNELNLRNINYLKHKSILGHTQPDAFIKPNICVYTDGDYWHNLPKTIERDEMQNNNLRENEFLVLRFWEHEINCNIGGCVDEIEDCLIAKGVL